MDDPPPSYEEVMGAQAQSLPGQLSTNINGRLNIYNLPTLKPFLNFNVNDDVKNLISAFNYKSKKKISIILCKRTLNQRFEIFKLYLYTTNETLINTLKNKFSPYSKFRMLIIGLTIQYSEYLARSIHNTVKNFEWMYYLLFTIPTKDMKAMKTYFQQKYRENVNIFVMLRMKNEEGPTYSVMQAIKYSLRYERNENLLIDQNLIMKDIESLNNLIISSNSDDLKSKSNLLNEIFLTRSFQHVKSICDIMFLKNNQNIRNFFDKVTPNQNLYRHVAEYALNKEYYFARTLFKSFRGVFSDVNAINHIFITHAEVDLLNIKEIYKQDYGIALGLKIKEEFQGSYGKALLLLLNENI